MSNTIPFPSWTYAVGSAYPSGRLSAGLAAAEQSGIPSDRLDALMAHDRPLATYMLRLLGSEDEQEQRLGKGGLSRLMSIMEDAA